LGAWGLGIENILGKFRFEVGLLFEKRLGNAFENLAVFENSLGKCNLGFRGIFGLIFGAKN
jgi:hypothetical protein